MAPEADDPGRPWAGRHPSLADRSDSLLLVVDLQEPFLRGVAGRDDLLARCVALIEAANVLGLPVVATEQYPERMGPTVEAVAHAFGGVRPIAKMTFSCCPADGVMAALSHAGRRTVVVCGVETHICISQTVHDLISVGYGVHVPADAVSARGTLDHEVALCRMAAAGAVITTTEATIFELLYRAGTDEFRALQPVIKRLAAR